MAFLQIDYKSEALMRGVNIKVILPSDGMAGKWEPPYKTPVSYTHLTLPTNSKV